VKQKHDGDFYTIYPVLLFAVVQLGPDVLDEALGADDHVLAEADLAVLGGSF
jgi:hypothetical protein